MYFSDSFEHEASNGLTYSIEVEGQIVTDDYDTFTDITGVQIVDEFGDVLDKEHPMFVELYTEALEREYEVENHFTDNSFYGSHDEL